MVREQHRECDGEVVREQHRECDGEGVRGLTGIVSR